MLLPGLISGSDKKKQEPFYRRYLVAGNPLDEKILDQEKRVEADPKSADLRNDFGNLLAARRFPKEAREQYELAMKLDPHHYLAPYNLGLLYETLGETGPAISAYEKSVDRNHGFPPSRFRLGLLYEKRGLQEHAIEQYSRAFEIDHPPCGIRTATRSSWIRTFWTVSRSGTIPGASPWRRWPPAQPTRIGTACERCRSTGRSARGICGRSRPKRP